MTIKSHNYSESLPSCLAVANYIMNLKSEISLVEMHYILYELQGFNLAIQNKPFFYNELIASSDKTIRCPMLMDYVLGAMEPDCLKPIRQFRFHGDIITYDFNQNQKRLMAKIVERFDNIGLEQTIGSHLGTNSAIQSTIKHYAGGGYPISLDAIKNEFLHLIQMNREQPQSNVVKFPSPKRELVYP